MSFFFVTDTCRANFHPYLNDASHDTKEQAAIVAHTVADPRLASPSQPFGLASPVCTWGGCEQELFTGMELHLENHKNDVLLQWTAGTRCSWNGCHSRAKFRSMASYRRHLKNIHTNPLTCPEPNCQYKKPFRNESDLERHRYTHSEIRPYLCPFRSCTATIGSFARKDKWQKHIFETEHDGDMFCHYKHCPQRQSTGFLGFTTREEVVSHFVSNHGSYYDSRSGAGVAPYRCDVGDCMLSAQVEHWTEDRLVAHLKDDHNVHPGFAWCGPKNAEMEHNIMVLKPKHMFKKAKSNAQADCLPQTVAWENCSICQSDDVGDQH